LLFICQGALPSSSAATLIGYHSFPLLSTAFFAKFSFFILVLNSNFAVLYILAHPPRFVNIFFDKFSCLPVEKKTEALNLQHFCTHHIDSGAEKEGFEPSRRLPDLHP
jgi:hypothetical protein